MTTKSAKLSKTTNEKLAGQAVIAWRHKAMQHEQTLDEMLYRMLELPKRDVLSYYQRLMSQKPYFKRFCNELHDQLYTVFERFIQGEEASVLQVVLAGAGAAERFNHKVGGLTKEHAIEYFNQLYTSFLSSVVADQDLFTLNEATYRDLIKSVSSISTTQRYLEGQCLAGALNAGGVADSVIFKTRFKTFNFITGGIRARRLYTIGGAPGVGKSAFLLNIYIDAAANEIPTTYITLENSYEETQKRIITHLAEFDLSRLHLEDDAIRETIIDRLDANRDYVKKVAENGTLIETYSMSVEEIRDVIERTKPKVLILDYLNLVHHNPFRDKVQDLEDLTLSLTRLAKEYNISIITACQLNRGAVQAKDPDESSVGDSFGIVKASDIFFTLYPMRKNSEAKTDEHGRPLTTEEKAIPDLFNECQNAMILKIAKSRFSALGSIPFIGAKNVMKFNEL